MFWLSGTVAMQNKARLHPPQGEFTSAGIYDCGWTKSCTSCSLLVKINLQNMGQKWDKPFTISLLVHTFGMIANCFCWSIQRMLKKNQCEQSNRNLIWTKKQIDFPATFHQLHSFESFETSIFKRTHPQLQRTALRG